MRRYLSFGIFAIAVASQCQSAKVIQLSPVDAATAKILHEQQSALDKKVSDFNDSVRVKYLTASKEEEGHTQTYGYSFTFGGKETQHGYWVKAGWGTGNFQFSEDFKFIVPSIPPSVSSSGTLNLGCLSPAFTTNTSGTK